jgi:hypothetical protein
VQIYSSECGRNGCLIDVEYKYKPDISWTSTTSEEIGFGHLADSRFPDDPRLLYAREHHSVPIAYDTLNPQKSALNFNDSVLQSDHAQFEIISLENFAVIGLISSGIAWAIFALIGSLSGSSEVEKELRLFKAENSKRAEIFENIQAYGNRFPYRGRQTKKLR